MSISRRDFINGIGLAITSGLTPAAQIAAQPQRYPPALTGLRGEHDGSFEVAHAFARAGRRYDFDRLPVEESYDLVVVGGGISGLSAAWFYRQQVGPQARILILDNHDDFGGHAKRNEFMLDGRRFIGYGGSQSMQSPNTFYGGAANGLLSGLGIDIKRFDTAFDRGLYRSLGLSQGLFFAREAFGRDVLVPGARPRDEGALAQYVAAFPISAPSKAQLVALYSGALDPLPDHSADEKRDLLKRTSYRDYLTKICGCSAEVADCFQGRPLGFFGLGSDAVPAENARDLGYPGFAALGLPADASPAWGEPYIYHFPDGNASLARLLVRALIPAVASGDTMEDVVLAAFDYDRLDQRDQAVRVRLDSTCLDVRNAQDRVLLGYVRNGVPHRVDARHAVLACFHMMVPHIMPDLPAPQRAALAKNVKTPIVYTNVLVRNWRPWINLKVASIDAPMSFHHKVALDFPVSLGGYVNPRSPDEPMVLHLAHVPGAPNQGLDARTQFRIGQNKLFGMTFADFEERIRDDLDRMLGPGGFSSARDVAAITVNRWPHGYSYVANSLYDPDDYEESVLKPARQRHGNVAIANTDAGGDAWAHFAIDQAARAVRELAG